MIRAARGEVRETAKRARIAQVFQLPAPTRGWIANSNLATPEPGGAEVLENWFPTAKGAILRRGKELYANLDDGAVLSMFSYKKGASEKLFAATESTIFDITTIAVPDLYTLVDDIGDGIIDDVGDTIGDSGPVAATGYSGQTGGDWIALQFATSGGTYLICVNGEDDMLIYDGTSFYPITGTQLYALNYDAESAAFTAGETLTGGTSGATATIVKVIDNGSTGTLWINGVTGTFQNNETITDGDGGSATADGVVSSLFAALTGVTTANLSYVWAFKNRVFFIEKDTLDAWYLSADAISGSATKFPLGAVFQRGGKLLFGASWSLDAGDGLSAQCIFVTTEGEVAVYAGGGPADWSLAGVYRIGKPLGKRAFIRNGGDLVIATDVGFVPLSQAIQRDYAALSPSAVSYPIEDAWNEAVQDRSSGEWNCEVWPTGQMALVSPPTVTGTAATVFVANARTGAWGKYTNWDISAMEVFQGRLYFGSPDGNVYQANVTGMDDGTPYTGVYLPLFSELGVQGVKTATLVRTTLRSALPVNDKVTCQVDYQITLPSVPDAALISSSSTWGSGIWGQSVWGESGTKQTFQTLRTIAGKGHSLSPLLQITSGALVPADTEIIKSDMIFEVGEITI